MKLNPKNAPMWVSLYKVQETAADSAEEIGKDNLVQDVDFDGFEVGISYLGPKQIRKWRKEILGLQLAEQERVLKLRRENSKEIWPELYGEIVTPEHASALEDHADKVIETCVCGLRPVDSPEENEGKEGAIDAMLGLSFHNKLSVAAKCKELQSPGRVHRFRTSDLRHGRT